MKNLFIALTLLIAFTACGGAEVPTEGALVVDSTKVAVDSAAVADTCENLVALPKVDTAVIAK